MTEPARRKTHTSTEVKRRYNEKTYKSWVAPIRNEIFDHIESVRGQTGMSRAAFLSMLVERYTEDLKEGR